MTAPTGEPWPTIEADAGALSPGSRSGDWIMVLGMSLSAFTLLHVVISLVDIATGFVVVYGQLDASGLRTWTAIFLATTVLIPTLAGHVVIAAPHQERQASQTRHGRAGLV